MVSSRRRWSGAHPAAAAIGGAHELQHTAVKIAPSTASTVHVVRRRRRREPDERRPPRRVRAENRELQDTLRRQHSARRERPLLTYQAALANRFTADWAAEALPEPAFTGRRVLADMPLGDLLPYIDWTFFFAAWELKGRFPAILDHPQYGGAARELYDNAQGLLERIVREKLMTASGVYGFWPAASEGDDIVVYSDPQGAGELVRFNLLRQQEAVADGKPNLSLADFIAPRAGHGPTDYLGAFAVTAGLGTDDLVRAFERDHDDYNAILAKALADRLAEAFAACLHQRSRREWGIDEQVGVAAILQELHRGIGGYAACPDHSEKFKLFDLLNAPSIGMTLTDHAAMRRRRCEYPYFSHPSARYHRRIAPNRSPTTPDVRMPGGGRPRRGSPRPCEPHARGPTALMGKVPIATAAEPALDIFTKRATNDTMHFRYFE